MRAEQLQPFLLLLSSSSFLPPSYAGVATSDGPIAVTDGPVVAGHAVVSHQQRRGRQPTALAKVAAKREAAAKQAKKEAKKKKQVEAKRQRAKLLPLSQPSHDSTARDTTIVYAIYGKHDSQELALWQRTWLQVSE